MIIGQIIVHTRIETAAATNSIMFTIKCVQGKHYDF
jgi:hypothetical protein